MGAAGLIFHALPASLGAQLVVAFAAGALSFFSPCVLPLVPGYLSLMSGVSVTELAVAEREDLRRVLRSTLLFVAGFTVVFVALGAGASAVGDTLTAHQRSLDRVAGALIVVMGLFLAGVVSPRVLMAERRFHLVPAALGSWGTPVMGMAFAFGWTPCIGPILGGVLTLADRSGTLGRGVGLLFSYSLGLGVPFVLTGLAFGRMAGVFSFVKRHFRVINLVSGLLLAGFGVVLVSGQIHRVSSWLIDVMRTLHLGSLTNS